MRVDGQPPPTWLAVENVLVDVVLWPFGPAGPSPPPQPVPATAPVIATAQRMLWMFLMCQVALVWVVELRAAIPPLWFCCAATGGLRKVDNQFTS